MGNILVRQSDMPVLIKGVVYDKTVYFAESKDSNCLRRFLEAILDFLNFSSALNDAKQQVKILMNETATNEEVMSAFNRLKELVPDGFKQNFVTYKYWSGRVLTIYAPTFEESQKTIFKRCLAPEVVASTGEEHKLEDTPPRQFLHSGAGTSGTQKFVTNENETKRYVIRPLKSVTDTKALIEVMISRSERARFAEELKCVMTYIAGFDPTDLLRATLVYSLRNLLDSEKRKQISDCNVNTLNEFIKKCEKSEGTSYEEPASRSYFSKDLW
ncbi:hypothetical protein SK355_04660 [Candidatus Fukatsuia symbiotica]|uniref:Uncharacterized protein n=1 Tax=Candidatus Fukatsuia symbiotica TaxID=1878942 RepID=A0A2U8I579_9GAMM|nr:hypothetical protein [Candidatus Fukatsuia symbiotica]AWK14326.1 hypothetical protein CCS41_07340 [Candidatus Fukatsuia symbiotica]MEA9444586.1 hypothetical protein [Candidatus Fukatsuia symbiotica]